MLRRYILLSLAIFLFTKMYCQQPLASNDSLAHHNCVKAGAIVKGDNRFRLLVGYEHFLARYTSVGVSLGYWRKTRAGGVGNYFHCGLVGRYYFGLKKSQRFSLFTELYAGYDREHYAYKGGIALRYGTEFGLGIGATSILANRIRIEGTFMPGYEPAISRLGKDAEGRIFSKHIIYHFITFYAKLQIGYTF
jgi:hypothetical protein